MQFSGTLKKMLTEYDTPVQYFLDLDRDFLSMNQLIGKKISLTHTAYHCLNCGLDKPIKASGYCGDCFFVVPQTLESIVRPEKSKAHLGIEERDLVWEKKFQLQTHIVYLANSSGLKVGVTRLTQLPTRWIDQGASQAIVFATTENRYQAGVIEVALNKYITDKTNYRQMLSAKPPSIDLVKRKHELESYLPAGFQHFFTHDNTITTIDFPIKEYPHKIYSIKLDKNTIDRLQLKGIKGQYLVFEGGNVLNVRSHEGFVVNITVGNNS